MVTVPPPSIVMPFTSGMPPASAIVVTLGSNTMVSPEFAVAITSRSVPPLESSRSDVTVKVAA